MARRALAGSAAAQPLAEDLDAYDRKVIADFSAANGRLKALPVQNKKFQAVLRYVLRTFEPGVRYSEKQVNELLARYHHDTAALRRGLVDYRLMTRETGVYWRIDT
jgi:hypothetical protein